MLSKKVKIIVGCIVSILIIGCISMYLNEYEYFLRGKNKAYYDAVMLVEDLDKDLINTTQLIFMNVEKAKTMLPATNHQFTILYPKSVNYLRGYIEGGEIVRKIIKESKMEENKNNLNRDHATRAIIIFKITEEQMKS